MGAPTLISEGFVLDWGGGRKKTKNEKGGGGGGGLTLYLENACVRPRGDRRSA